MAKRKTKSRKSPSGKPRKGRKASPAGRKALREGPAAFEARVGRRLASLGLFEESGRWLVGLSGGPDSVALLRVLHGLSQKHGFEVAAVHVHHGIRGKSADQDAAFCKKLCAGLEIPFREYRIKVAKGSALAERARKARYEIFEKEAQQIGAAHVALAHQQDDQAETVLSRLVRGAPAGGLAGIPPVRGIYVRPLLCETREAILHYLEELGQNYRKDPSNKSLDYERVRVREQVIPYLEKSFRRPLRETLARAGLELGEVAAFLEEAAGNALRDLGHREKSGRSFVVEELRGLPRPVRRALWQLALQEIREIASRPQGRHVDALEELLASPRGRGELNLGGGIRVLREKGRLTLTRFKS